MPTEDEAQTGGNVVDPYTGEHAESVYAIWHDPTTYDTLKHGPPYLPEAKVKVASAGVKEAVPPLVEKTAADALTAILIIITHIKADFGDEPMGAMAALLAFLRAESMVHQAHHWQTHGGSFYGDHQLFDRLYNATVEDIDKVAERMVGSGHHLLAQPVLHAKHVSAVVQSFYGDAPSNPNSDEYVLISLRVALRTLVVLKLVYSLLDKGQVLTHGTDNLLQGVADKHEEHVYLLKQRSLQKTSYDRRPVVSGDNRWKSG